jgi:hypothetical protein
MNNSMTDLANYLNGPATLTTEEGKEQPNGFLNQNEVPTAEALKVAQMKHEMQNIKETQQQHGIAEIGDLFRANKDDIQDTLNSVYSMVK